MQVKQCTVIVYSDPASERRNQYARAREDNAARHMQRRERSQPAGYPQHIMIHLSDLETSDSTRQSLKDPGMLNQHKKVHTQPTSLSYPTRTDNYIQAASPGRACTCQSRTDAWRLRLHSHRCKTKTHQNPIRPNELMSINISWTLNLCSKF